jgi:hypothetical protein
LRKSCQKPSTAGIDPINEVKAVIPCPLCRKEGDYYLSNLNTTTNQWERWKLLPHGIKGETVYGAHRYSNAATGRQYQHYIIDKSLMFVIAHEAKLRGYKIERPPTLKINQCKQKWNDYCSWNNDTFKCQKCLNDVIKLHQIVFKGCKNFCPYCICRSCFLTRITTEDEIPGKDSSDGYLLCKSCDMPARAYYKVISLPVAAKDKKGLMEEE